jgi:serine/threonine protein kinase/tetratricopeptide (TPR) repeat protein
MTEREIFEAALEQPPEKRDAHLDRLCEGDEALRQRLQALLRQHQQAGSFLENPVLTALAPLEGPGTGERAGAVIGRYKLLEQIGEGGMGTVWMAQQTEPVKRLVAVKLIKPGMDSRTVLARFEAERQALALMDHPNIAKVLDGGAAPDGRPFFVMELVKGIPITRYCDEHRLTPRQRLELFIPVCQAIQHAHQKGIIHRDLKPSNVLVVLYDDKPVPKVIDFGVAKATGQQLTEETLHTGFGAVVGTVEYMSPEQASFNQLDVDTRSDVYSLGVLLYELLAGSPPFTRKELEKAGLLEMLRVIREQEPPRPSSRLSTADGLPTLAANRGTEPAKLTKAMRGELDWIVMKTLEKDRNRRYETVNGLAMDVQRYLADEPVLACPPSAMYRFRKFSRRNKVTIALSAVVIVALIAVTVAWTIAYRNEQRRLAEKSTHEEQLQAEKRENALEKALTAAMSGDFSGAEKAIDKAELLGASAGQIRILRGQIAFHRGDLEGAIQHLEQAAKLLAVGQPGAVAARALLALAYANAHKGAEFDAVYQELEKLVPISPEDFLFKGQVDASFLFGHGRGLQDLDEAIRRRPDSSVVRLVGAEVRTNRAMDTGELRDVERALEDAQVARTMLHGNPLVLARSVYAHLVAAGIYEDRGRMEDRKRVLAQARQDVQEVERLTTSPIAARACFEYFEFVGDEESAYAASRRGVAFREAVMLYRRREFDKALDASERNLKKDQVSMSAVERGFILAELTDGPARARASFQEAKKYAHSIWQVGPPMILLLLGQKDEAIRASLQVREVRQQIPARFEEWYFKYIDYTCALITEEALLQAARHSRMNRCEAHFAIGLRRHAEGDRKGAKEHFQKCVDTRAFIYFDYTWARAFLKRMEEDPRWPRWIEPKE